MANDRDLIDTASGQWREGASRPSRGNPEIQGLQFVRANAVLLVVLCHSAAVLALPRYFGPSPLVPVFAKGATGVDIFFVLSGFIIVYIALEDGTLKARTRLRPFLLKRFNRIVPFLWVAVITYGMFQYIGTRTINPIAYLNALFFIPIGPLTPNVVWSLQHEALFYVVFALAFLLRRRAAALLYVWCAAPIVIWILQIAGVPVPQNEVFVFVFNRANAFFGCGVLVGLLYKRFKCISEALRLPAPVGWAAVIGATIVTFLARDWLWTVLTALAASLTILAGLSLATSRTRFARGWHLLGDASYAIYLTHNMFLLVGGIVWVRLLGAAGYEVAIGVLAVIATAGGVLIHLWVEKPVIRLANRLTRPLSVKARR